MWASAIGNTALIKDNLGRYELALKDYEKSYKLSEYLKDSISMSRTLMNISLVFRNFYKDDIAYSRAKKAITIAQAIDDQEYMARLHNNLGYILIDLKKYEEAIGIIQKGIKIAKEKGDKFEIASLLENKGRAFQKLKKYHQSKQNIEKANIIYREVNYPLGILGTLQSLSSLSYDLKKYDEAYKYLKEVYKLIDEKGRSDVYLRLLFLESKILYEKKEYKKSFDVFRKREKKRDSILDADFNTKLADFETKYQTQQKENEILKLSNDNIKKEAEAKTKSTQLTYSLFGGGAILLLSLFTLRAYRREKKSKEQIEIQKQEIETLHKEVHHRVKNNLAVAKSFTSIAKENVHDKKGQEALNALQSRIDSMANVHEILYKQDNISAVSFQSYTERICEEISKTFDGEKRNIRYSVDANIQIPINEAIPLGLILNEAVTNSFKYAFNEKEEGNISIQISEQNNEIKCAISDDGTGISKDFNVEELKSYGMELMQTLVMQLEGSLEIKNQNGTQINITISKN